MKDRNGDIRDDEIRIITSGRNNPKGRHKTALIACLCLLAALILAGGIALIYNSEDAPADESTSFEEAPLRKATEVFAPVDSIPPTPAYTARQDTAVNGVELEILFPNYATPVLEIGDDVLGDSSAILAVQAADIRKDNGKIVGSFVVNGGLVSKSEAKAGFCSIINGEITVGVADATPMLEQVLLTDGYFFRQYPLVVGGQIVENKPKGRALRKALAEIDDRICVILSRNRVTYHDFSQALTDIGVRNAIALVGGNSCGSYTDADGTRFYFTEPHKENSENVNFIVWR